MLSTYYLITGISTCSRLGIILPGSLKLEVKSTFRTVLEDFRNEVKELLNLLAARIRVLGRKKEDINKARLKVTAYRVRLAKRTDNNNRYTIRD
ncbi:hypothetical protein L249_7099 [Ophiocordyceps polyrhachis-furcata BCC 54312]|uniref:Uncharacterized protein n=1 Tax=Ophiocordyceps polyrhachis-furcata BCC 54312 TaxID=1330021 RepID=A0A367LL92_9HYPO|nr:hypothetical protein L249_7099 [Ophiocordyceps polyrhachis-furcata BCC 54312]